jgi:hypothetical protein
MLIRIIWAPVAIAVLAALGFLYQWPLEITVPVLSVLFLVGIIIAVSYHKMRKLERLSLELKDLAVYFIRRFTGHSSLSIFAAINGLFNVDSPGLREWVGASSMSQLIFNAWCEGFAARVESDNRAKRLRLYYRTYLGELWSMVIHYQDFIEQFYEVAEKIEIPQETTDQYNKFVTEYNSFAQRFQGYIGKLRSADKTEIEPPSVKLAKELTAKRSSQPEPKDNIKLPEHNDHKGYIM